MAIETLYIARHSLAEDHHPQHPGVDEERRLTAKGVDVATQVFRSLGTLGFRPDRSGPARWPEPTRRQRSRACSSAFGIRWSLSMVLLRTALRFW